ncbi:MULTISPECIES: GntR family transcriptional regulator [unclassified Bradyrhizobium]|uniref:GntR family transcriptional regulator n=1 Tax=unclassified Bradyrhizobium TaxID=2631580 RepID=UPI0028E83BA1|nr:MULTISPECIES: GntR family transcriptional regulator [unclassified Bradyrhizobium]
MKKAAVASKAADGVGAGSGVLPVPLYEHVKRQIAEAILIGELAPGTVLPGEVALAHQYGVAVGTIRRALADLTAGGMLMRRRKTGTVVTGRASQHGLSFFFQYFRLLGADGSLLHSEAEVLSVTKRAAAPAEAALFATAETEPLLHLHRIRRVAGAPVLHSRIAMVASRVPEFPRETTKVPALIYRHLLETYGIRIAAVREKVTAEVATKEDRTLLNLSAPGAVLVINEEAYDQTGALAILSQHRATTAGHYYSNEIR